MNKPLGMCDQEGWVTERGDKVEEHREWVVAGDG